eukprot:GFKZ01012201.1.p1 GENE.GFKZ01012201.1~~GFKZ01012201.1.p1  ORF type:complete len:737 (-),score=107.94 GFKZ01012201.1:156-2366(-)
MQRVRKHQFGRVPSVSSPIPERKHSAFSLLLPPYVERRSLRCSRSPLRHIPTPANLMTDPAVAPAFEGVGLIVPPPEVKEILETTARFVAKRPALEARVLQQHEDDPRFSFLQREDPYYAYYRLKISQSRTQATATPSKPSATNPARPDSKAAVTQPPNADSNPPSDGNPPDTATKPPPSSQPTADASSSPKPALSTSKRRADVSYLKSARAKEAAARREPRNPPRDDLFTLLTPNPAPYPLSVDVMKLTAQFVARYGRDFGAAISQKERRNSLFDFMRPLHPHFLMFQKLVDAYSTILGGEKGNDGDRIREVKQMAKGVEHVMDRVWYMHDWDCMQAEREQEAAMNESERVKTAQIDWHDFVVLETVDVNDNDADLPAPITDTKHLPKMLAAAKRARQEREKNKENVDMEIDDGCGDASNGATTEPKTQGSGNTNVTHTDGVGSVADIPADRIRRETAQVGVEKAGRGMTSEARVALPSGQQVPLSQVEASVRVELLDPSYKDERARAAEKNRKQNLAGGEEMARNLARWEQMRGQGSVYNRGDLQGMLEGRVRGADEREVERRLGRKVTVGPELPRERVEVGMSQPAKRARVEAAVDVLSRGKGGREAEVEGSGAGEAEGEVEVAAVAGMMTGSEWIKQNGASSVVRIRVPVHGGKEWKLEGQEIEMSAKLKSTVGKLKAAVAKFTKLPAKKQKLMIEGVGFLKDGLTLADYNIADGTVVVLEVKERGGKRRNH